MDTDKIPFKYQWLIMIYNGYDDDDDDRSDGSSPHNIY